MPTSLLPIFPVSVTGMPEKPCRILASNTSPTVWVGLNTTGSVMKPCSNFCSGRKGDGRAEVHVKNKHSTFAAQTKASPALGPPLPLGPGYPYIQEVPPSQPPINGHMIQTLGLLGPCHLPGKPGDTQPAPQSACSFKLLDIISVMWARCALYKDHVQLVDLMDPQKVTQVAKCNI